MFLSELNTSISSDLNKALQTNDVKVSVYSGGYLNILIYLYWLSPEIIYPDIQMEDLKSASLIFESFRYNDNTYIGKIIIL